MQSLESLKSVLTISASSATAAAILNHFATRRRNRKQETVSRLTTICGKGTARSSVVRVLKQLEASGFGTFKSGRRGHESRFVWAEV